MMHCNIIINQKNNRLCKSHNLLFFVLLLLFACKDSQKDILIVWDDNKAKAISIPAKILSGISKDSIAVYVKIRKLHAHDSANILGDYRFDGGLLFEPTIPFQRGADYTVWIGNKNVAQFHIAVNDKHITAEVITIYPLLDTLPENLLKIYIQFSQPMREGESVKHVKLLKNNKDTLPDVFLDLQPELWNDDRTAVTIWLDPGRIKRDLQPNLRMGAPLHIHEQYQLVVLKQWQDAEGISMQKDFSKSFVTTVRDSLSPDPVQWKLSSPKALSKEPLTISFGKALDHFLLLETLQVTGKNGVAIKGKFESADKDRACHFIPDEIWAAGTYTLRIASKLEDLAGNNVNRPFDRDISKTKEPSTQEYYSRSFNIEK
jgi:hypothetical protein